MLKGDPQPVHSWTGPRPGAPRDDLGCCGLQDAVPPPAPGAVREVGIDGFAIRRGHHYATPVIDMGTHRPVDVLPDRTSETTCQRHVVCA